MDFVESFGALTLDHRFKRLMHRLLDGANEVYATLGFPFKPRWQSTFSMIADFGPVGVTEVAEQVKLSHPAIIQITDGLLASKLIQAKKDPNDARRRVFVLTAKGRRWEPELKQIWNDLAKAQSDAFRAAGWDVLEQLKKIESELDRRGIHERVLAMRKKSK